MHRPVSVPTSPRSMTPPALGWHHHHNHHRVAPAKSFPVLSPPSATPEPHVRRPRPASTGNVITALDGEFTLAALTPRSPLEQQSVLAWSASTVRAIGSRPTASILPAAAVAAQDAEWTRDTIADAHDKLAATLLLAKEWIVGTAVNPNTRRLYYQYTPALYRRPLHSGRVLVNDPIAELQSLVAFQELYSTNTNGVSTQTLPLEVGAGKDPAQLRKQFQFTVSSVLTHYTSVLVQWPPGNGTGLIISPLALQAPCTTAHVGLLLRSLLLHRHELGGNGHSTNGGGGVNNLAQVGAWIEGLAAALHSRLRAIDGTDRFVVDAYFFVDPRWPGHPPPPPSGHRSTRLVTPAYAAAQGGHDSDDHPMSQSMHALQALAEHYAETKNARVGEVVRAAASLVVQWAAAVVDDEDDAIADEVPQRLAVAAFAGTLARTARAGAETHVDMRARNAWTHLRAFAVTQWSALLGAGVLAGNDAAYTTRELSVAAVGLADLVALVDDDSGKQAFLDPWAAVVGALTKRQVVRGAAGDRLALGGFAAAPLNEPARLAAAEGADAAAAAATQRVEDTAWAVCAVQRAVEVLQRAVAGNDTVAALVARAVVLAGRIGGAL
ncbi:hypothetical protein AMAG_07633 [Allomyces macrogynus ATCC 38327]|uniref:Uncharacterized protein n=1 Tax=Allomyces macrogynus (strain ATCC 38327) TaxID=578462 RepID=A0A0L0SIS7_ALLM3|nr:hypothetical protein AMAG_07633 [Allomyces macrogynus ATCC 38327]|eukprot:KNE62411.1 hypothetical protein AMAG_07633 [Allomyces macrogynus ATCC 38327]